MMGQCVRQQGEKVEVKAVSKRVVTLFVDPGERGTAGEVIPENQKVRVLHVRND